jgi:hypothetical protein
LLTLLTQLEVLMTRGALAVTLAALALLLPTSAAAQQDVVRHGYAFFDRHVTIEVAAPAAGSLQLIRGESGRLEVAARSVGGFPAFALGGQRRDHLRLTAAGAESVDFIVVVPENVVVRLKFPGEEARPAEAHVPAAMFHWVVPAGAVPAGPGTN